MPLDPLQLLAPCLIAAQPGSPVIRIGAISGLALFGLGAARLLLGLTPPRIVGPFGFRLCRPPTGLIVEPAAPLLRLLRACTGGRCLGAIGRRSDAVRSAPVRLRLIWPTRLNAAVHCPGAPSL